MYLKSFIFFNNNKFSDQFKIKINFNRKTENIEKLFILLTLFLGGGTPYIIPDQYARFPNLTKSLTFLKSFIISFTTEIDFNFYFYRPLGPVVSTSW